MYQDKENLQKQTDYKLSTINYKNCIKYRPRSYNSTGTISILLEWTVRYVMQIFRFKIEGKSAPLRNFNFEIALTQELCIFY